MFINCRNERRQDQLSQLMVDVCRNIDLNKSTHSDDMAIIVLQSLEVRIYYKYIVYTILGWRRSVMPIDVSWNSHGYFDIYIYIF